MQFAQFISVSNDYLVEILKACFYKLLIQINRSKDMSLTQIQRYLLYWLKIEYKSIKKLYNKNNSQLKKVAHVMSLLSKEQNR